MRWRSKCRFCFVQVDQTYQPWHKRCSLPPCGPYIATSNTSPNNKVNTRYNGQFSNNDPFAMSSAQIRQIYPALHTKTSSSEWRQEWLGGRKGLSIGRIVQHKIQKAALGGEKTRNALFKQWREREMDRRLCGLRDCWSKKESWRRWDNNYERARRYEKCWKGTINNQNA